MRFLVFGLSGIEIRLYTCFYTALSSIGRSTAFHTEKLGSIPSWATEWELTASFMLKHQTSNPKTLNTKVPL